jgi:nucleoside-diphosphate-sugar epimerase
MPSPRVVVLGATGFVAGSLIRLLEAEGQPCRPVGSREADLTDPASVKTLGAILKPEDALVFCSALTPEKGRDRAAFLKNVRMADHVCAALSAAPCAHVVYISSDSVYGSCAGAVDEQSGCETNDLYGLAHIVREKLMLAACAAGSIPLCILRPGAIFGAEDTHDAYGPNRFVRSARATGRIALFGEGEEHRDHIYIRDLARLIQLAVHHRTTGVLNAVSGSSPSFCEIALSIQQALNGAAVIESLPRRVPIVHRRFDATALRTAFPEFQPTPLAAAIREMLAAPMAPPPAPAQAQPAAAVQPAAPVPVESSLDITLMVPCLNEEQHIVPTLDHIFNAMRELPYTYEVLVIDDGSTDRTSALVEEYAATHPDLPLRLLRHEVNRGLARTYVDGAFLGRGMYYRQVCGDNVEAEDVLLASLRPLGKADMIIPYRETTPGKSAFREWLSRLYTRMVNALSGYRIRYYNGQATHLRYNVMRWGPYSFGFGFQAELITRLLDEGATYIEVQVFGTHQDKAGKNSALNLKNFLSVTHTLLETVIRRIRKGAFRSR